MAVINIDDAYILNETGAQVDKVTGLFTKDEDTTEEEKEFAQLNIGASGGGGGGRNLLDNPWWGLNEVVNQRENTSGQTTVSYSIDRWRMTAGSAYGNWSLGANGLTITAASGTYAVFQQLLEPRLYKYLAGKTVTCSALLSDGTVVSGTVQSVNWSSSTIVVTSGNIQLWLVSGGIFRVLINNGGSATIRAVKLELGSVSTLVNDAPPKYKSEYDECAYYFRRLKNTTGGNKTIGIGYANAGTQAYFVLPYTMRTLTSTNAPFTAVAVYNGSSYIPVTSIQLDQSSDNIALIVSVASGLTAGNACRLALQTGGYIDLPADL